MKISKYIRLVYILVGIIALPSCNDFLDELPDNRVELSNKSDIEGLLANALPDGSFYSFTHSLSDNAGDAGITAFSNQVNEESFKFQDYASQGQDTPLFYWISCYESIANTNLAIEYIENLSTEEQKDYESLYGEALVARAYNHFMLVNIYCKHYEKETCKEDLGIPYVTKPEKEVLGKYTRGTVHSVYENILSDLTKGLPLLKDDFQKHPMFHFTNVSAHAFASRVYLYLGNWDKVISHSNHVLGGNVSSQIRSWNDDYMKKTSSELEIFYSSSNEKSNLLIRCAMSNYGLYYKYQRYGLTENIKSSIFDVKLISNGAYTYKFRGYDNPDRYYMDKFKHLKKRISINADLGYGYMNHPLFTVEEVLFNYLEASVMKDRFTQTLSGLNDFFSKRVNNIIFPYDPERNIVTEENIKTLFLSKGDNIVPSYDVTARQKIFIKAILHARRAEFMFEGLRWFDIKRFNLPVIHIDANRNTFILESKDLRKAIQIPTSTISLGLTPNPRN